MFYDDDLADYLGFRHVTVEAKIEECLDAKRRGADNVTIDTGDLTDGEIAHLKREVRRRIENGDF